MPRRRHTWTKKRKTRTYEKWYTIKSILDERNNKGEVEYLVDWENDPDTGKVYENSWTKSAWVTDTARTEWQARKTSKASKIEESAGSSPSTTEHQVEILTQAATPAATEPATEAPDDSEGSQPPRPANWRHLQRKQSLNSSRGRRQVEYEDSEDEPLSKKRRRDHALRSSEELAPSITSGESFPSATSYNVLEEVLPSTLGCSSCLAFTVDLHRPGFDTSDYHSVQASQSSHFSSQPISELEAEDKKVTLTSNISQKTIPDSQDTSDPSLLGGHTEGTSQSSHNAQQHIVPYSQSQFVPRSYPDEAIHTLVQPGSTVSSVPEEFIPDSTGSNTDIPSRQPAHQLDFRDFSDHEPFKEVKTGLVEASGFLSSSPRLDFAEQEAQTSALEVGNQSRAQSYTSDASQPVNQSLLREIANENYSSETLASNSETQNQRDFSHPQSVPISHAALLSAEVGGAEPSILSGQGQQQVQPSSWELEESVARDFVRGEKIQDSQQKSLGSEGQITSEPNSALPPDSVAHQLSGEAVREETQPKHIEVSSEKAQELVSRTQVEELVQLEQPDIRGYTGAAQVNKIEAREVDSENRETVGLDQSNTRELYGVEGQERAPTSESRGVSQAPFLFQPDFPKFHSRLSSSYQAPLQAANTLGRQASVESKHCAPTKSLPEYSPGILISLCEDSQDYSDAMLETENDETATGRPSALASMRAIWDDEPDEMEKKANIAGNDPPLTEPLASPSNYHSVSVAGPSGHGFFSQLSTEDQTWTANESSNIATEGVASSRAVSEMRKLLGDDYLGMPNAQPATVSPADVSLPSEAERLTLPVLPSHDAIVSSYSSSGLFLPPGQLSQMEKDVSSTSEPETAESYLVTLPFSSNIRQLYYNTLMKYGAEANAYGDVFTSENLTEPEPALSAAISNLFAVLRNFCDYPENALDMKDIPLTQKVKYYTDANSKLNFLYELFQAVAKDTRILIVARSPNILRMICNIAEDLHLEFSCEALSHSVANPSAHLRLTLSLPTATVDPWQYDVAICYDSVSSDSEMMKNFTSNRARKQQTLILRLAIAFTIEHIEAEIPPSEIAVVRKAGVLGATVNARYIVLNPPRLPKPHEIAVAFSDYINKTTKLLVWDPEPLPAAVLDIYASQTTMTQTQREISVDSDTAGRKRKPDVIMDAETKRLRVEPLIDLPPLSDSVQAVLREAGFTNMDSATTPKERQLNLPLAVVELLAQKYLESQRAAMAAEELEPRYRTQINNLQRQIKDRDESQEMTYRRFREAIADRTQFEADAQKAVSALNEANGEAKLNEDKSQKKIAELETVVARLTQDSAVAANEKSLQEAHRRIQMLEKRLETSHTTEAYTRDLYQAMSSSVHATNSECERLRERNTELEKVTSENMVKAQQEQFKISSGAYLAKIAELETSLREAQLELDRTREENRSYRNGRRETRQVSVPCSPRVGSLMSPRPRAAFGGPTSRAASPAPVMGAFDGAPASSQFSTPSGNSRFIRR